MDNKEDEHFGSGSGDELLNNEHTLGVESSLPMMIDDRDDMNVGGMTLNDRVSDNQTETSVDDMGKLGPPMRKQDQVLGAVCDSVTDNGKIECTFRRGGICNIHEVKGTRKLDSMKVWAKKKNGLFGFVRKQKTEYECHFSGGTSTNSGHQEIVSRFCGVAESDLCNHGLETEKQTSKSALGGKADNLDTDTTIQGISGVGSFQTGSKMSESQKISDELKDPD